MAQSKRAKGWCLIWNVNTKKIVFCNFCPSNSVIVTTGVQQLFEAKTKKEIEEKIKKLRLRGKK